MINLGVFYNRCGRPETPTCYIRYEEVQNISIYVRVFDINVAVSATQPVHLKIVYQAIDTKHMGKYFHSR